MMRHLLLLSFFCLATSANAQYSEPFSVPNKGYLINNIDDLTGVNWSLSPWNVANRDAADYFYTTAAGVLESIDLDEQVYWESPLINTTAAPTVSIKMDLTWKQFDSDVAANDCSTDWIKVEYSVNGGAYVMIPNLVGGNACATIAYPFVNPGQQYDGMVSINHLGVAGGSTLKIRVRVFTNVNAELVTIDNVAVPEAGVTVGCAAPNLSTVVTPVGCSNPNSGAIDLTVTAGTPGYIYSWTGGATTQDLSNKPTGTYTVTVTDAASCSATISATIGNAPTLTLTTLVLDASCSGNMDGEVSLDVSGGVPGYTYDWSNDGAENPDNDPQDLTGIGTGTYTVTVTDASGCTKTASATVGTLPSGAYLEQFNVANKGYLPNYVDDFAGVAWTMGSWAPAPPAPFGRENGDYFRTSGGALVGIDFDQEICWTSPLIDLNGGTQFSVDLSWVTFDQEDYINVNYSIDGGAFVQVPNVVGGGTGTIDYPVPALDQSGSTTVTKTGLSGGTIQIQVCGNFNSESMTVDNVNIPGSNNYCPAPEPSLTKTDVSCNGGANGTITTTVTNGTPPYTYAWSDGGVTTQNRTGLAAGTYTVTVTDANFATGTASIQITQPTALVLTETHVNVLCNGAATGSIDLSVTGGTPAYIYSWTGGATTQDRSGLTAGTYTVTVTDSKSCTKTLSVTITQPTAIVLTETHINPICNGQSNGSIDLTPTGGTGAYTYAWTGGATTQDRSGLAAGTYTVTVIDANACTKTLSVAITQPNAISVSAVDINVPCRGDATGGFNITVSGGTPGYTYDWSNNGAQNPDTDPEDLMNVVAGTYTVTITDANGCLGFFGDTVKQPATFLTLSTTQVNVLCNGGATGSIDLTPSGGGGSYTYAWIGGATTQDRSGLAAGTYTVTVTDANTCSKTISATITEPAGGISLTETHVNVLCNGAATGSIDLSVSGGVPTYIYAWTGGATTQDRSGLAAGTYTVTVTDANSCSKTLSVTITETAATVLTETHVSVLCNGGSTGSIDLTVSGGTPAYTYSWTGGATTQDRTALAAGTYTVTVTDANFCTKTLSVTITEPTALILTTTSSNVLCNGGSSGSIDLTVSGGVASYTYSWTGGATTQDRSGLAAGTYSVTVTDANNCTKTTSVTITEPSALNLTVSSVTPTNCFVPDGSIDLGVSGGTASYTYDWSNDGPENPDNDTQDLSGLLEGTYTVTVTDANACTASSSITLDYTDNVPPTLVCPANSTINADANCSGQLGSYSPGQLLDNCTANPTLMQSPASGTPINGANFVQTITLTATDQANNTSTCNFTVTLKDVTAPSISCPANTTVNAGASCTAQVGAYAAATLSDNCNASPSVTQSPAAGTALNGHNDFEVVTLTANDGNGNTASCSLTVTLKDVTAPGITCPANTTINANASCAAQVGSYTATSLSDNCNPSPTVTQSPASSTVLTGHNAAQTVTLTANDGNGNTATCSLVVTLKDVTPPSISCPANTTINAGPSCSAQIGAYAASSLSDNCNPSPSVTQSPVASTLLSGHNSLQTVTLTANDGNGNTATCTLIVTLKDVTAPSISCPANTTVNAGASCTAQVGAYTAATLSDNCNASPSVTQSPVASTVLSGHNTVQTVTLTANDGNGNTATCSLTVTVKDVTAPGITCPPNTTVNANASCSAQVGSYTATSLSDNCNPSPTVTQSPASSTILTGHNSTQTVTLTANDGNGNTATCSLVVTLKDVTPPSISCPANTTINAGPSCSAQIGSYAASSLSDNCNPSPSVTQSPVASTLLSGHNSVQTVTLTANDGNGNTATCTLLVTLKDVTAPSITCPANAIVNANASCAGTVGARSPLAVSDNCNASPTVTQSPAAGTALNGHNDFEVVTLTANDGNGNMQSCTFTVTLKDVTPPNITCPGNITLNANASCSAAIGSYLPAVLSDNCNPSPTASQSPVAGTLISGHNTVMSVTLTGSDGNGNNQNCNFTITLKDVTPPAIVCKNFVANLDANGFVSITPNDVYQSGSDNCGVVNLVSVVNSSFTCNNLGPNLVTLTANDGNGNSSTCNASVTVRDLILPVAKCKNITANLGVTGTVNVTAASINNGSSDNCSFTLTLTPNTFNCSNIGANVVTLKATDTGGNMGTCTAIVTVKDASGPNAKCKNPTIYLNNVGEATLSVADVNNGSTDNCGIATMSINLTQFNCSELLGSPWPVTMSLTDVNGNASSCLAYVSVRDAIAPTAICEDVTVALGANGKVTVYGEDLALASTDNCSVWSYSPIAKVYTAANLGPNNLTITVKDWSNNASTCVSVVTVEAHGSNNEFQQGGNGKGNPTIYDLLVYPNPSSGAATVAFQLPAEQVFKFRIFDTSGRMIYDQEALGMEGENVLPLKLDGLAPGVYLIDFQSENLKVQKRLILQR